VIPLGANHFPVITRDPIEFFEGSTTEVNFSDQSSPDFIEAFASSAPGAFSPMIELAGQGGRYLMLGGGDASANGIINIEDIAIWDTHAIKFVTEVSGLRYRLDGNVVINLFDFNVWARMRALGQTWAPYEE